jgi:hypothetical protein
MNRTTVLDITGHVRRTTGRTTHPFRVLSVLSVLLKYLGESPRLHRRHHQSINHRLQPSLLGLRAGRTGFQQELHVYHLLLDQRSGDRRPCYHDCISTRIAQFHVGLVNSGDSRASASSLSHPIPTDPEDSCR